MTHIDLNNFHEWQQKFLCGMLSATDEETFLQFLEAHPELMDDAILEEGLRLEAPALDFEDKASLKKEVSPIDELPLFDFLAIKKMEQGLSASEHEKLAAMVTADPQLSHDVRLYEQTKLVAQTNIVFDNKSGLKRVLFWQSTLGSVLKYSAAAAVIAGVVWFSWPDNRGERQNFTSVVNVEGDSIKKEPIRKPQVISNMSEESAKQVNDSTLKLNATPSHRPATKKAVEPAEIIDPYLEPDERQLAMLDSRTASESIEPVTLNGFEKGLEVIMPLYLDNQLEIAKLMALMEEENKEKQVVEPVRESLSVTLVENGVKLANVFGIKSLKFNKYYDQEGNFVAYKIKGDGLQLSRRVK